MRAMNSKELQQHAKRASGLSILFTMALSRRVRAVACVRAFEGLLCTWACGSTAAACVSHADPAVETNNSLVSLIYCDFQLTQIHIVVAYIS